MRGVGQGLRSFYSCCPGAELHHGRSAGRWGFEFARLRVVGIRPAPSHQDSSIDPRRVLEAWKKKGLPCREPLFCFIARKLPSAVLRRYHEVRSLLGLDQSVAYCQLVLHCDGEADWQGPMCNVW